MKKAATDPDAKAFVDYLLGTEGQTYFAAKTFEYPLVAGVATAAGPARSSTRSSRAAIDLNDLDTLEATIDLIKEAGLA